MPASPKTAQAPIPTMIESYFLKKVAKPFEWVIKDVEYRRATYRMEVIGVEDNVLHVGVHRITFNSYGERKGVHVQLPDIAFSLSDNLPRAEILDRVAVLADQGELTSRGNGFPSRLVELLNATGLGHLYPYSRP